MSSGWALGSLCGVLLITCAMAVQEQPATFGNLPDRKGTFEKEGWGSAAPVQNEWQIDLVGPDPMTFTPSAARCASDVYLVDAAAGIIHHVNLDTRRRVGVIGLTSDGMKLLRSPHAAAADCAAERLYVVDTNGVHVFNTQSAELESRFTHPPLFRDTSLSDAFVDAQQGTLYVPGLWSSRRQPWLAHSRDAMLAGATIGYVLNLWDGSISRGFPAIDKGCWSWTWDCASVVNDRGSDGVWAVAHMIGTDVGIFAEDRTLMRRIDVRSDLFRRSRTRLLVSATAKEKFAWHHWNSVIARVFRFEGLVATIHLYYSTERPENGIPNFEVFMNIHRLDGTGVLSDVKLPGVPLFRDERSLYIVDYGPGGRRQIGFGPLTIVSVPVLAADGSLHAALTDRPSHHMDIPSDNR